MNAPEYPKNQAGRAQERSFSEMDMDLFAMPGWELPEKSRGTSSKTGGIRPAGSVKGVGKSKKDKAEFIPRPLPVGFWDAPKAEFDPNLGKMLAKNIDPEILTSDEQASRDQWQKFLRKQEFEKQMRFELEQWPEQGSPRNFHELFETFAVMSEYGVHYQGASRQEAQKFLERTFWIYGEQFQKIFRLYERVGHSYKLAL